MKYQEFIDSFVKSNKTFMAYQQGNYFVRVIKVPLAENVQALYASRTYSPEETCEHHRFEFSEKMETVGFVDCHNEIRFPTFEFIHYMVDDGDSIAEETRNGVLAQAILAEVNKLAMATPLPACPNEDVAYQRACEFLYCDKESASYPVHKDFSYYINDNVLIDYLAETPGWAEHIAKKWSADFGSRRGGVDITNLDVLREGLSVIKRIEEYKEAIMADKTHKIHRYIAMRDAVKAQDAKAVTVEFKTADGKIDATKVNASAFYRGNYIDISKISLYNITPCHESDRVANLLPKIKGESGREYTVSDMNKDDIVAIKYGRKTIWSKEDSN